MELEKKKVLVVGLARTGLAAANFLLERGAFVTITDLKREDELEDRLALLKGKARLRLGAHNLEDFLESELIVLSPGVPSHLPEIQAASARGVPVCSEVELAYRFLEGKIVGVTGSNGKTTTTALIGELFKRAGRPCVVAGNIGTPLIQSVERPDRSAELPHFVVELSSFQLENIHEFKCDIAVVLNVSPDHLDRYASFDDYARAKERIFLNQTPEDCAVLNLDNPHTLKMSTGCRARVLFFSRRQSVQEGVYIENECIQIAAGDETFPLLPSREIALKGQHNLENLMAAAAVGFLCGLDREVMIETFRAFSGVEHRLELVRKLHEVTFYNDSKATNVDSAAQAIQAFDEPLLLIMGGRDKGGDFSALEPLLERNVKLLLLIGESAGKIEAALGNRLTTRRARDLKEAVRLASVQAEPGDIVLLSPACASFDMFDDFEHRGRVFKEAVWELS